MEETLNNTTTVCGNQHIGGFVLLERVDGGVWRAYEWSAFFARLVLPVGNCRSFCDNDGNAVTELSAYDVMQLGNRLEVVNGEHRSGKMVFIVLPSLVISQLVFDRWRASLLAESNKI